MVQHKKWILGLGLAAAGFFIIALLIAGATMGGDGGMADDRIADLRESGIDSSSGEALAASLVSSSFNYQGRLTDSAGNPLNGTYTMTFGIYEASSGGTALGIDTNSVNVANGLFKTTLDFDPSFFDGRALWLGIKVGDDAEMTPRQELRPVPYALSLRPGAVINGSVSLGPVLQTINNEDLSWGDGIWTTVYSDWSYGIWVETYGDNSEGVFVGTVGDNTQGVSAHTSGNYSEGVYAETYGYEAPGVYAETSGYESSGLFAFTTGNYSEGVYAETSGYESSGLFAFTTGNYSEGVFAETSGYEAPGVNAETSGYEAPGVNAVTLGDWSEGVLAETYGNFSRGVVAETYGYASPGLFAVTLGNYSGGVYTVTLGNESEGVYVDTYGYGSPGVNAHTSGPFSVGVNASTSGIWSPAIFGYSQNYYGGMFDGAGDLGIYVYGNIYKTGTVSFVEDHPTDPTKEIVYVCLEGGETGTYTRGSGQLIDGAAVVQLPEHFSLVTSAEGLTVQVTPTSDCKGLSVVSKSPTELVVKELNGGTSEATFDYIVNGVRKGYDDYQPIRDKQEMTESGDFVTAPEHLEAELWLSAEDWKHRD